MAKLVALISVPHDPTLPAAAVLRGNDVPEGARRALTNMDAMRARLAAARPDAIVMVGSDHLNQLFLDNMPPFLIGKAERLRGPFADEQASWKLAPYDVPIDRTLARALLHGGYERGVDFAFSDEFTADHAFTIPLNFLRPEQDLPVVPVFINLLVPPVPPGWRYHAVGGVLRDAIEAMPGDARIAVVTTAHMSNSVGGPGMFRHMQEPETAWDRRMWDLLCSNDMATMLPLCTWPLLYREGNGTPGFLGFVLTRGIAGAATPDFADLIATSAQPACAFLAWDEASLAGGRA